MKFVPAPSVARVACVAIVGIALLTPTQFSSASFTAASGSTASVTAASDWTPPLARLVAPAETVKGGVELAVEASDAESGIARVTVSAMAPGATTWTTICTDTAAPFACTWNTASGADGTWTLRAAAVDGTGLETLTEPVSTTVANTLSVVLAAPAEEVRGTVALSASVFNVGAAAHTVRIEYAVSGTTAWRAACSNLTSSPYTCGWATAPLAPGDYDLRAVLSVGSTVTVSEIVEVVMVDNVAPLVSMTDPGSPLRGLVTLSAIASDADSGVEQVTFSAQASGTTTWQQLCVVSQEPWSCKVPTASLVDGTYSLRAVASDAAGNTATSVVNGRVVDNTVASVVVDAPLAMSGVEQVAVAANSTAGVASVRVQFAPTGTAAWTDVCTDNVAEWGCAWDTRAVPGGTYDLRAIMLDSLGRSTTSATSRAHLVDNTELRGVDVQAVNGGARTGRPDGGDTITFTYSSEVAHRSLLGTWDGLPRAVTVRLRDGALVGRTGREDALDVMVGTTQIALGQINLKADRVRSRSTVTLNATMALTTVTGPDGADRSVVTVRVTGVGTNGSRLRSSSANATMVWSPSASATGLNSSPCSTAAVTESGASDRDF